MSPCSGGGLSARAWKKHGFLAIWGSRLDHCFSLEPQTPTNHAFLVFCRARSEKVSNPELQITRKLLFFVNLDAQITTNLRFSGPVDLPPQKKD